MDIPSTFPPVFLLSIILSGISLLTSKSKYNSWVTPHSIVVSYVAVAMALSSLSLTGIFVASLKTYLIMYSGMFAFASAPMLITSKVQRLRMREPSYQFIFRSSIVIAIFILIPSVYFLREFSSLRSLMSGAGFRGAALSGDLYGSSTLGNLFKMPIRSIIWVAYLPLLIIGLKYRKPLPIAIVCAPIILFYMVELSRGGILSLGVAGILVFFSFEDKIEIFRKQIKSLPIVIGVSLLFVASVAYFTFERISDRQLYAQEEFVERLIDYRTMSPQLFDMAINDSNSDLFSDFQFGRATVGGGLFPIEAVMRRLRLGGFNSYYVRSARYIFEYREVGMSRGGPKHYNAYYSTFLPFYADFGIAGVILISLIWGYSASRLFMHWQNSQSIFALALAVFLYLLFFNSLGKPASYETPHFVAASALFALYYWSRRQSARQGQR